ncbi:hypothetical protein D2E30_22105 [Mycobacteroides abscessus]|uniref:SDR family NAD(P)-dependent oxidoreductase n=1 Tax=Mycobacteroides abscessus TaxID=36809 RepID=A0ABD7HK77_9MYCO|nr:hypothetical protein DDJ88_13550 [Mycobacteroides abscessus]PVA44256.1 hypothetical protein DDJ35_22385 [Mycobacteroides abscessus]PVB16759.1 hypothetical protein DDJ71_21715 [Mycobacteroides abscessus]RIQ85621.1 hypothetical protein D2E34_23155 [Mycobacteroides abscessus]RIQ93297.1 hypothetical protein D2E30_22105 [Mycobacteroides abscessus]
MLALADGEARREPTKVLSTRTSTAGLVEISGIDGKIVVITGTSSGIGETIARLLAERGRLTISRAACRWSKWRFVLIESGCHLLRNLARQLINGTGQVPRVNPKPRSGSAS